MTTTLKRTSMALDLETLEALESLSKKWSVSKAEVMRRSIKKLQQEEKNKQESLTPIEALMKLKNGAGISQEEADQFKAELKEEREAWRDPWENYDTSGHQHSD